MFLKLDGRPGTCAPHIWVEHQRQRISTLDLFGKSFILLVGSDGNSWCQAVTKVASDLDVDLVAYRAGPTGDLIDPKRQWESIARISAQGALLIHPDAFVAWRAQTKPADLQQTLKQVLKQVVCI